MYRVIMLYCIIFWSFTSTGKEKTMSVEELKSMGRDKIIALAVKNIKEGKIVKNFSPALFDRIKVMASTKSVFITFRMSYAYLAPDSVNCLEVKINLMTRITTWQLYQNPDDLLSGETCRLVVPDESARKAVAFVKEVIKANKMSMNDTVVIYDKGDHYQIVSEGEKSVVELKIEKLTGKIYDVQHMGVLTSLGSEPVEVFEEITK